MIKLSSHLQLKRRRICLFLCLSYKMFFHRNQWQNLFAIIRQNDELKKTKKTQKPGVANINKSVP